MNRPYLGIAELPRELPVFPLAGCLLLPQANLPLNIFEPRYLAMVDVALAGRRLIGMIQPLPDAVNDAKPELCAVGCAGRITQFAETGNGRYFITLEGVCRFRIGAEMERDTPFRVFNLDYADFSLDLSQTEDAHAIDRDAVLSALRIYAKRNEINVDWEAIAKLSDKVLVDSLCMMSPFGIMEKQALLEARDLRARAAALVAIAEMDLAGSDKRPPLH
ncbi:MAG: LON peptidase substrate-binding domain-containing protein [Rhodoblastus sp.]